MMTMPVRVYVCMCIWACLCVGAAHLGHIGQRDVSGLPADPDREVGFECRLVETGEGSSGTGGLKLGGSHNSERDKNNSQARPTEQSHYP